MICYDVELNGRRLCVAGASGNGVLGVNLTWVKRSPARRRKGEPRAAFGVEEHTLQVGGLFGEEHVDWVSRRRIRAGDVVRIRVLRRATADGPATRKPVDPPGSSQAKKAYLSRMKDYLPHLRREIREQERRERRRAPPRDSR